MIDREELLEKEVDLSWANFRRVRMYESSFENCFMEGADFSRVNLSYVDLRGAKKLIIESCKNMIFYETIMPDGSIRTDNPSN